GRIRRDDCSLIDRGDVVARRLDASVLELPRAAGRPGQLLVRRRGGLGVHVRAYALLLYSCRPLFVGNRSDAEASRIQAGNDRSRGIRPRTWRYWIAAPCPTGARSHSGYFLVR